MDTETILFLTDTHIGAGASGFVQQPRRMDLLPTIIDGVNALARQHNANLVVHGGDLTEHGSIEEIEHALKVLGRIEKPLAFCLGNHDLAYMDSMESWKAAAKTARNMPFADTFVELIAVDVILLNNAWVSNGVTGFFWFYESRCVERLLDQQLAWLEKQLARSKKPAIVVVHSPLNAIPPRQHATHERPAPVYAEALSRILDRHARVKLVLSGHNHVNSAEKLTGRCHVTTAAVVEAPFELRLIRINAHSIEIETPVAIPLPDGALYDREKAWVNGSAEDRTIRIEF